MCGDDVNAIRYESLLYWGTNVGEWVIDVVGGTEPLTGTPTGSVVGGLQGPLIEGSKRSFKRPHYLRKEVARSGQPVTKIFGHGC